MIISIAALVVSVVAVLVSIVFYCKSAKALQHAIDVLAGYLEGTIKGADITFNRNKKGHTIGLNVTVHLEPVQAKATVGGVVTVVEGDKKLD